ncbi:MAG TPA: DsrE/DsrF/DrsH-like family protein [Candidatus Limnocylindrales bacterium]|jgi:peroxiredoxin family protein|nr:DsrE/DsrF/DrsH-like family protein [Candidatus Limnocylindrales bacterium]
MTIAAMPVMPGRLAEPIVETEPESSQATEAGGLAIILYSGELEKTWAAMILASTAGAMGKPTKVFVTFWGLQTFVRPERRVTGRNWMQRMLSVMSRPGIAHRKLSKMQFFGMGPWMMNRLAAQYHVASPAELLETAASLGVEFIPCQMTMDMFGLTADDLIEGMGEPVGAATYLGFLDEGAKPLFI